MGEEGAVSCSSASCSRGRAFGSFRQWFSAVAPRRDVVGFHLFNLEKVAADGANAVLPFVNLALGVVVEGADAKMGVNNYLTPRYVNVKLVMKF